MGALLGEGRWIEHQDALGIAHLLDHVTAKLAHDRFVIPFAAADKELKTFAMHSLLASNGFSRLTLQAAEQALNDDSGVAAMLSSIEKREILPDKPLQSLLALSHLCGRDPGPDQQCLRLRVLQQRPCRCSIHADLIGLRARYAFAKCNSRSTDDTAAARRANLDWILRDSRLFPPPQHRSPCVAAVR
jgi:hypothetical protein